MGPNFQIYVRDPSTYTYIYDSTAETYSPLIIVLSDRDRISPKCCVLRRLSSWNASSSSSRVVAAVVVLVVEFYCNLSKELQILD
jgi:hypothetical protein